MRNTIFLFFFITAAVATFVVACDSKKSESATSNVEISKDSLIARGAYLVNAIGCDDCHSPKRMGEHEPEIIPELRFSGYPASRPVLKADTGTINKGWMLFGPDLTSAAGPWGMSFAANLTSDDTGIGTWSEAQFFKAIREGKSKGLDGSRNLLPPMPWFVYKNLSDTDIRAIFTFLKSTKPVENIVPAPKQYADL